MYNNKRVLVVYNVKCNIHLTRNKGEGTMELGGFNTWKIVEYNNNFACPINHQYA
jgi:hypothetical protein